jgi:hypothetical protein
MLLIPALMLSSCARSQQIEEAKMPVDSVVPSLKEIDQIPILTVANVRGALDCDLQESHEDSAVLSVYRCSTNRWKGVELRLLSAEGRTGAMLILKPAAPVSMNLIVDSFGKQPPLLPPNPAAGPNAVMGYEYVRPNGRLRITFQSFQNYFADSIIFDRMPDASGH